MIPYTLVVLYRWMKDETLILTTVEDVHFAFLGDGKVYDVTDHRQMREVCPVHIADGTLNSNPSGVRSWRLHFTTSIENVRHLCKNKFVLEVVIQKGCY